MFQHGGLQYPTGDRETYGTIVPGSGTGDLASISGSAIISVDEAGKHSLTLDYTLE